MKSVTKSFSLSLCFLCLLVGSNPFGLPSLQAQSVGEISTTITLDGLTLPCSGCVMTTGERCQVEIPGESLTLLCRQALEFLLRRIVLNPSQVGSLDLTEMRRYLLRTHPEPDYLIASLLLEALAQSAGGEKILIEDAAYFSGKFRKVLLYLLQGGRGSDQLWLVYWRVANGGDKLLQDVGFRSLIAARVAELGLKGIFSELSVVNIEQDLQDLLESAQTLTQIKPEWAKLIRDAREMLLKYQAAFLLSTPQVKLQLPASADLPQDILDYLDKVKVALLVEAGKNKTLSSIQILDLMSQIKVETTRSLELHSILLEIIKEGIASAQTSDIRQALLSPEISRVLAVFAANDTEIAGAYDKLLNKQSRRGFSPYYLLLIAVFFFFGLGLQRLTARKAFASSGSNKADTLPESSAITELEELFKVFNLPKSASEDELSKEYRRLAKAVHPDADSGDLREFQLLTDKYNKAKLLLRTTKFVRP